VAGLATNTAQTVWQRLHDEEGLRVSVRTFRRYVRERIPGGASTDQFTVRKEVTPPGEVAEIDYGRLGPWFDPLSQRRRVVNGFLMTLAFSRHVFVDPVLICDERSWVASHVAAFEFFGAVPAVLRIDNLKTGVLRPDLYDPKLNRAYAEMAEHYGVLIDPCRAGRPKDKAYATDCTSCVRSRRESSPGSVAGVRETTRLRARYAAYMHAEPHHFRGPPGFAHRVVRCFPHH
jgi:transposase